MPTKNLAPFVRPPIAPAKYRSVNSFLSCDRYTVLIEFKPKYKGNQQSTIEKNERGVTQPKRFGINKRQPVEREFLLHARSSSSRYIVASLVVTNTVGARLIRVDNAVILKSSTITSLAKFGPNHVPTDVPSCAPVNEIRCIDNGASSLSSSSNHASS